MLDSPVGNPVRVGREWAHRREAKWAGVGRRYPFKAEGIGMS
jgi:hypothetical protein